MKNRTPEDIISAVLETVVENSDLNTRVLADQIMRQLKLAGFEVFDTQGEQVLVRGKPWPSWLKALEAAESKEKK